MPLLRFMTGIGNASMNIVRTGAINDSGQLTTCENNMQSAVPNASRRIRTLAILIPPVAAEVVLEISVGPESEGISQETRNSDVHLAHRIEYPTVAGIYDYRSL